MKKSVLSIVSLAAFLLCACGDTTTGETSLQPMPTAIAQETTTAPAETTAAADSTEAAAPDVTQITTDAAQTDLPAETTSLTALPVDETTLPAETTEPIPTYIHGYPQDLEKIFGKKTTEIDLPGKGTVNLEIGLNLRKTPETSGVKLSRLEDGQEVEILGVAVSNNDLTEWQNRWYHVKVGSLDGYASAEYIAAEFSQPAEQLTDAQLGAMDIFLYYQYQYLYLLFTREGGMLSEGTSSSESSGEYVKVLPDGMKLADLNAQFYKYFSKSKFENVLTEGDAPFYMEKDGSLWVLGGYGDNVMLDYTKPITLEAEENGTMTVTSRQYFNTALLEEGEEDHADTAFQLVYEDGIWKCAGMTSVY